MRTTIEHDGAHWELPADTAVEDDGAPTRTATQTDTAAVATPGDRVPGPGAGPPAPTPGRQSDAPWIAVALVALATIVIGSLMWLSGQPGATSTTPVVLDAVGDTTIDPAAALERLVARGYVPQQAIDGDQAVSTALVRQGLVPGGRFDDPALRDLQTHGLVPGGVTVDEDGALRDLQSRGLVPSGRFDDPALRDLQSRGHVPAARGGG